MTTIWRKIIRGRRKRRYRMRGVQTSHLTGFFDVHDTHLRDVYPEGCRVYIPEIHSEDDTLKHYSYLSDLSDISSFPASIREFFAQPLENLVLPNNIRTVIYNRFEQTESENDVKLSVLRKCLYAVLSTGRSDIYFNFLSRVSYTNFVKTENEKIVVLWFPGKNTGDEILKDISIQTTIRVITSRKSHDSFSRELISDVFSNLEGVFDWPSDYEMKEYSVERIETVNQVCHPVIKNKTLFQESDESSAERYVKINDSKYTMSLGGEKIIHDNTFSNYIVYLNSTNGTLEPGIAITPVNFGDIGSKHAHILLNKLPEKFMYLFSGEIIKDTSGDVFFNTNSGMFYHTQIEQQRRNDLSLDNIQTDQKGVFSSYLCKECFNWELFAAIMLRSLLQTNVSFMRNLRPYLELSESDLDRFCKIDNFSFKEYVTMKQCTGKGFGREKCKVK